MKSAIPGHLLRTASCNWVFRISADFQFAGLDPFHELANAIFNATGMRMTSMPITRDKILGAMG